MIDLRHCRNDDSERGLATLADKSVDHIMTDPPYDADTHAAGAMMRVSSTKLTRELKGIDGEGPKQFGLGFDALAEGQIDWCAKQFVRLSRGWVLVFCATEDVGEWKRALVAAGAKYRGSHLWFKTRSAPKIQGNGPAKGFENFVLVWAGANDSKWNGGGRAGNYSYAPDVWQVEGQKPHALMRQLVLDFTLPEQTVLDPFMGRGTTGVACKALGRSFLGYEMGDRQFGIAERNIAEAVEMRQTSMFATHREVKKRAYGIEEVKPIRFEQIGVEDHIDRLEDEALDALANPLSSVLHEPDETLLRDVHIDYDVVWLEDFRDEG